MLKTEKKELANEIVKLADVNLNSLNVKASELKRMVNELGEELKRNGTTEEALCRRADSAVANVYRKYAFKIQELEDRAKNARIDAEAAVGKMQDNTEARARIAPFIVAVQEFFKAMKDNGIEGDYSMALSSMLKSISYGEWARAKSEDERPSW